MGDWRLGGSVAGKYCSGGGFGLGGLARKGREGVRMSMILSKIG